MELRIFARDQNLDIMDQYLNQGQYRSIPVFVFLDHDLNELGHWIERPAAQNRFVEELRAELAQSGKSEEEQRQIYRQRSAEAFRQRFLAETIRELKELLTQLLP